MWGSAAVCVCLAGLGAGPSAFGGPGAKEDGASGNGGGTTGTGVVMERLIVPTGELHHLPPDAPASSIEEGSAAGESGGETGAASTPGGEYRIGPGDLLQFQSFDDPAISREQVIVLYDGTVSLPLIPDLDLGGATRREAEEAVRLAYTTVFRDPQLSLNVRTAGSKSYYEIGRAHV